MSKEPDQSSRSRKKELAKIVNAPTSELVVIISCVTSSDIIESLLPPDMREQQTSHKEAFAAACAELNRRVLMPCVLQGCTNAARYDSGFCGVHDITENGGQVRKMETTR